ncbi:unnamed protein product [Symbiodinium pilosum]|uniref:Uncharacterized protein n=1 Tax=Symbiodinium pilosum TaxID=2952 RepID=A0A812LEU7_SYMPI|nr:unnamed protein product [Symbiodinium pilosum]
MAASGFFRKTSLPSAVPSQASQVIRKSLDGTLRKFEAENEKSIDLPAQPHASFDLRHQKGLEAGEEASGDHVGFRTRSEDKGLPNEFNKGFSAAPCTLSSSSCSSATADAEMAQQEKEATPVTGNHERFGQQRARTKDAEAAEEQDLLDLLPMPGTSATKGAFGALDPEQQSRAFMKPEGEGCFWTEASVDTFDDEFLCCTELPEEASNGWEQAASRSTRSASSGSPPNHRRPLKAGLDTSAGTSTSQAKPAEFSSHSGPLRKGSGAERTQSPESPDERTEYAEQQHQQNQQNDPQLLRNDLPVAQPLVGPASNHSKLRRGSKTTAGRSKDARDRARESEKERRTSTNSASAVIASEGGKSSRRRSSTRNSKGANSAGVPIHVEEAELSEPESVVTDSDLSEFLQELFRQYSTSRDKKGRPLLSNAGLRRFLQEPNVESLNPTVALDL